jgi:hypothetical protein
VLDATLQMNFSPRSSSTPSRMSLFSIFRTFALKSAVPSGASATPMRYYCTCHCMIFMMRARISTPGRDLSGASAHLEALCFEGMERLMRRRNLDKGL